MNLNDVKVRLDLTGAELNVVLKGLEKVQFSFIEAEFAYNLKKKMTSAVEKVNEKLTTTLSNEKSKD
jgi:hypothetical protein